MSSPLSAKNRLDNHNTDGADFNCFTIPSGVELFAVDRAGDIRIEIIPYTVPANANNPFGSPGNLWYERTYWAHRGIGANSETYVCPAKTYNLPCPVCEARAKINRDPDGDKELAKSLAPKERQLWWIYSHAAPDKGLQLWDISHHLFGKQLDAKARSADPGDNWEFFADPTMGFTVKASFVEESFGGGKFYKTDVIDFKRREATMPAFITQLMQNIPAPLDSLLKVLPYAQLNAIFMQQPNPEQQAQTQSQTTVPGFTPPAATAPPTTQNVPGYTAPQAATQPAAPAATTTAPTAPPMFIKGGTVTHPTLGICTVFKVNSDGTATLMDADDNPHKNIAPWGAPPATAAPTHTPAPPPKLEKGDPIVYKGAQWRIHKVATDGVVIMNAEDDIEKITIEQATAGRVSSMISGSYGVAAPAQPPGSINVPSSMNPPSAAPAPAPAPASATAAGNDVPWDDKW